MRGTGKQSSSDQSLTLEVGRELITIKEFARLLSISVWAARKWAYAGKIASVKLGSRLQIPIREVARIINDNLRPRR